MSTARIGPKHQITIPEEAFQQLGLQPGEFLEVQVRVFRSYRLTLQLAGDTYLLRRVGPHDVIERP